MSKIIRLPVAPQAVARTRFSPPPPACNQCLQISEAMELLDEGIEKYGSRVTMAAIAGPGDPLATPDITFETIQRIKDRYPELDIGILSLGIGSSHFAGDLAKLGARYVEMKVEAVRAAVIEKLFAWIRPGAKTLKLSAAAQLLIKEQSSGVSAFKFHGLTVSIVTTLYPAYNIDHVAKVSSEMQELGADNMCLVPYCPAPGVEVDLAPPTSEAIAEARIRAANNLPLANPVIFLEKPDLSIDTDTRSLQLPKPSEKKPNVAVVSSNGIDVDLHLGHALKFLIYGPRQDGLTCLLETRDAPEAGSGSNRWKMVADILDDCFILLTASAGKKPRQILADVGLRIFITEDNVEGLVDVLYGGGKKKKKK